jgi:hypothetical protein
LVVDWAWAELPRWAARPAKLKKNYGYKRSF